MRFNNFWSYRRILFSRGFTAALWHSRENLIAFERGRSLKAGPYMAELDITYQCNCRCEMCDRWEHVRGQELTLAEYGALAEVLHEMGSHQISIAGGEPLLRADVFAIIEKFAGLGMSVNLCTNGLLLRRFSAGIRNSGATCVTVSVDGGTGRTHDKVRGVARAYRRVEEGLEHLLRYPFSSRPIIRVRMTISHENMGEVRSFYDRWHGVADDVLIQPVHRCQSAYYTASHEELFRLDPEIIGSQVSGTPLGRNGYLRSLLESLRIEGSFPRRQCYAGILMARIDPWGRVYPCLEQHVEVGSIRKDDFRTIWNSIRAREERRRLSSRRPCRCWYNNTALIGHYGGLLQKTF